MRCPKCGAENPQGKILCRVCGTRLRAAAGAGQVSLVGREGDEELRRRVSYDLVRILWVVGCVIAVGLTLGVLFK